VPEHYYRTYKFHRIPSDEQRVINTHRIGDNAIRASHNS